MLEGAVLNAGESKCILVIEDDIHYQTLLRILLEREGYRVMLAPHGRVGLDIYRRDPADLVIVDIFMPEMDGLETITRLRQDYPGARIIAISSGGYSGLLEYLDLARCLGADQTMHKPFKPAAMLDTVRLCFGSTAPDPAGAPESNFACP